MDRRRLILLFALAACVVVFLLHANASRLYMDDSYISLRYAQNLVRGHGLVFNPGEWVEGYSNFSWTMILAAFMRLGVDGVEASRVLGVAFGAACVLLAGWAAAAVRGRFDATSTATAALVAASTPLALWSTSGMETALFAGLITAALFGWLSSAADIRWWASAGFALAALTRPDGALFFVVAYLVAPAKNWRARGFEALAFAAPLGIHLLWKWGVYGELLPNTYYAKAGVTLAYLDRGLAYAGEALMQGGLVLVPFALIAAWHPLHRGVARRALAVLAVASLYVVAIGGDVLPVHRFWVPMVPTVAVLCVLGVEVLLARRAKRLVLPVCAVLVLASWFPGWAPTQATRTQWAGALGRMEAIGRWMGANLQPEESVAATAIGAIAYYSNRRVIDMLGLTNPEVSRNPDPVPGLVDSWKEKRYNAAAVLGASPTYFLFSTGARPSAAGEKALFLYEEFHRSYASFRFRSHPALTTPHFAYRRRPGIAPHELGERATNVALVDEFERGITASLRGKNASLSAEKFEAAMAAAPFAFPMAREWHAVSLYQMKDPRALEALEEVTRADPLAVVAWRLLGWVALRENDLPEAGRRFEHLCQVEPQEPFGWGGLGEVAAKRGDLKLAKRLTQESLRRWSTNTRAQSILAALANQE